MIIESMYFPPVSVLMEFKANHRIRIDQGEYYRKGSFRNKCFLNSANGPQLLSVPLVKGKNNLQPMKDVKISYDENWPRQHMEAIKTCYGNSPYFIYFMDQIENVLFSRPGFLIDLNQQALSLVISYLLPDVEVSYSKEYIDVEVRVDRRDSCRLSNYLDFKVNRYSQVFEDKKGFVPNLSSLDLLLCMGKYGNNYL
ncbi:MAG: WbqC family protein [Saprospiraceae bacterium]|nr:WbqC family protein [Saprospiraceae bacterium]